MEGTSRQGLVRGSPLGRTPEARESQQWHHRCQPLQGGGKGRSCVAEAVARAAGQQFVQPAVVGHHQSLHGWPQPGPGSDLQ